MHGSSEQNVSIGYFWTDFMRQKWEKMSLKVVLEVIKWKKKKNTTLSEQFQILKKRSEEEA